MSLNNVRQFQATGFPVPRYTDKEFVSRMASLAQEGGYKVEKSVYYFTFTNEHVEFGSGLVDAELDQLLSLEAVSARSITIYLNNSMQVALARTWDSQQRKVLGNQDTVTVNPSGQNPPQHGVLEFAKLLALTRKHFGAVDTRPFLDFLDAGTRELYQSRDQDLQRLERMQETFFTGMTEFTLDQQKKQQEFQRQLEQEYAARQSKLEEQHQERLRQFEEKESELKRVRAEIDERENRQARRDIYKDLKTKLDARNKSFELTEGTRRRRRVTFTFSCVLLVLFAALFLFCFYTNVSGSPDGVNWVAVGSQVGSAVAFAGAATFFIRWNNQWFQKHADEEFKLKRLDLDIDRANWLVELAMEWRNVTKSDIPPELTDKLARSLFQPEEARESDIHPAETLLSAVFGRAGSINVEFPGKMTLQRSTLAERKSTDDAGKKDGKA